GVVVVPCGMRMRLVLWHECVLVLGLIGGSVSVPVALRTWRHGQHGAYRWSSARLSDSAQCRGSLRWSYRMAGTLCHSQRNYLWRAAALLWVARHVAYMTCTPLH